MDPGGDLGPPLNTWDPRGELQSPLKLWDARGEGCGPRYGPWRGCGTLGGAEDPPLNSLDPLKTVRPPAWGVVDLGRAPGTPIKAAGPPLECCSPH